MDALSWIDGAWQSGNPRLLGACDHATWLSSIVFDGARAFGGLAPDLALHAARADAGWQRWPPSYGWRLNQREMIGIEEEKA